MDVTQVVELRVHGVSGTPPEALLDRDLVTRVAGNATAGFYRPTLQAQYEDRAAGTTAGAPLEGYAWGGLTSGAPSRAFWLLLLPFTLVNIAPRMRPRDPANPTTIGPRYRLWWFWYLCRMLALALSALIVLAVAGIGVDLIGWQCASGVCSKASPAWLVGSVVNRSAQHRLLLGAIAPLAALAVFWLLSRRVIRRYEQVGGGSTLPLADADDLEIGLASPSMWRGEHQVGRMLHTHLQAGFAATLATVAWPVESGWRWAFVALAGVAILDSLAMLGSASYTGHGPSSRTLQLWIAVGWATLGGAATGLGLWLGLGHPDLRPPIPGRDGHPTQLHPVDLPGFAGLVTGLFAAALIVIVALTVVVAAMASSAKSSPYASHGPRTALRGFASVTVALMGVFLAVVFSAGSYIYAAAWLSTGSPKPSVAEVARVSVQFTVPDVVRGASLAYSYSIGVLLAFVVLLAARAGFSFLVVTPGRWLLVGDEFSTDHPGKAWKSSRGKQILRIFLAARLVDIAGAVVAFLAAAGAVITVGIGSVVISNDDSWLDDTRGGWHSHRSLQGTGAYLVIATLLAFVTLGAAAYRVNATRRGVGILWDIASFWPRSAHPLSAPCYAERAVPDLVTRVSWYLGRSQPDADGYPGGKVVLAGHSQGSVLSAAAILQLAQPGPGGSRTTQNLAFISFGCVLRRLYGRYFPAYFGPEKLEELKDVLKVNDRVRWRNLWRHSDYLGGRVAAGPPDTGSAATGAMAGVDVLPSLIDPIFDVQPGDTVSPEAGRHSNFPSDPRFQQTVAALARPL